MLDDTSDFLNRLLAESEIYTDLTFDEIERYLPNLFHFLDYMIGGPLSPSFWAKVGYPPKHPMFDHMMTDMEDYLWNVVEELVRGTLSITDFSLRGAEQLFAPIRKLVNDANPLDMRPWWQILEEILDVAN